MISESDLRDIRPRWTDGAPSTMHIQDGLPIPKSVRVQSFSPTEWKEFTEEWASCLKNEYTTVRRFGGSGDLGISIAGFCSKNDFEAVWDNYQRKRYDHPLRPREVWVEMGKIIYYSFLNEYLPPHRHFFICSQGIKTSLERLLNKPIELKEKLAENWGKGCQDKISPVIDVPLAGELKTYFDMFDSTIFSSKSLAELIEVHLRTVFHSVRFGSGLPCRPNPDLPPDRPADNESRHLCQLLDAYGDHLGTHLPDSTFLDSHNQLKRGYLRQRERFHHVELLKNFARDAVPAGTFDQLQDEIFHGAINVCEGFHDSGSERMEATIKQATIIAVASNPLVSSFGTQDRQGICHQLANDGRLNWVPNNEA